MQAVREGAVRWSSAAARACENRRAVAGAGEQRRKWWGPWLGLVITGTALWGAYRVARPVERSVVTVSAETVAALGENFTEERQRPPTADELDALVDDWVEREVLIAEARARGLDRADPIVRRRLVQKMGFVLEDASQGPAPDDPTLQAYMDAHADDYRRPPRRGFRHVFVGGHDDAARGRAQEIVAALHDGAAPDGLGDPFAHGVVQAPASTKALADRYGDALAQAVEAAPSDRWIVSESVFGLHVLIVDRQRPGELPPLAAVRARVIADWQVERRAAARREGVSRLVEDYDVRVER